MYSAVLVAALVTTTTTPAWCHRSHGCHGCYGGYSGYSCYAGYSGYSGYGCHSCHGCHIYAGPHGYGAAGGCYGYHGGCYSGFGVVHADPWHVSTGCYGCYGGHSGYGVPLPGEAVPAPKRQGIDPFPPINPKKEGGAEEIGPLKEKKGEKKKEESVRAKLSIEVPEGGKLFVDGKQIATKAGTRAFQTPDLKPGQTYYYDIRIEVERNGNTRGEEQRVVVQAGQGAFVYFPTLRPAGTIAAQNR